MDAVARPFKQVWRCSDCFKIQNLRDHKVLFVFEDERDVNFFLLSVSWSFDKHLLLLKRYEQDGLMGYLKFEKVMIWVQVHDIPYRFMSTAVAENICNTIGEVIRAIEAENEEGGGGKFY